MKAVLDLFQGATQTPAVILAIAAFVLGMIAMCLLCKLFCPCGKKSCKKDAKKPQPQKKEQRENELYYQGV